MSSNTTYVQFDNGDAQFNNGNAYVDAWYGVFFYQGGPIRGSVLALWFYALLGLCLRFYARRLTKADFWYDDWLLIPAMVSNDTKLRIWSTDLNVSSQQR